MKKKIMVFMLSFAILSGCSQPNALENDKMLNSSESTSAENDTFEIADIAIAFSANIMLTKSGDVYTWGINEQGVLGLGLSEGEVQLTPANVDIDEPIETVEVNPNTNSIVAISKDGNVYVWGQNHYNIFPGVEEDILYSPTKVDVPYKVDKLKHSYRYMVVEDKNGNTFGCGWNGSGGAVLTEPAMRNEVSSNTLEPLWSDAKGQIVDFYTAGLYRTYIDKEGSVYIQGRLVESETDFTYDTITKIKYPEPIVKIIPLFQGLVGLSDSGSLYFLGEDRFGIASEIQSPYDAQMYREPFKITKIDGKIVDIQASTSSILVRTESNEFYTWGYNLGKNVAESDSEVIPTPTKLNLPTNVTNIKCGEFSGVAICSDNTVYAWGSNGYYLFMEEEFVMQYEPKVIQIEDRMK